MPHRPRVAASASISPASRPVLALCLLRSSFTPPCPSSSPLRPSTPDSILGPAPSIFPVSTRTWRIDSDAPSRHSFPSFQYHAPSHYFCSRLEYRLDAKTKKSEPLAINLVACIQRILDGSVHPSAALGKWESKFAG